MSWMEPGSGGVHQVRVARLTEAGWGEVTTVARGADLFRNWADFPAVVAGPDGRMWTHWLQRLEGPGLAYAIRVASSRDAGVSWSEPWTPHQDGTATEHGFVSLFPWQGGLGLAWLDGRKYAPGPGGEAPTREMTVRARHMEAGEPPDDEVLLDARACDCCQTDVALTDEGPVVVYRDRTENEVRDVFLTRWTSEGWEEGRAVHDDGWVIGGCPVNGPAVDARGQGVAVAWFTGARDTAKVLVAFSGDAGRGFDAPIRIDGGNPAGRVDVRLLEDGTALVTWLERSTGDDAELRLARVGTTGVSGSWTVTRSSSSRTSGFPRMTLLPWDPAVALLAWTDVSDPDRSAIRVARLELPR